jgi:hypothetical protein
VTFLHPIARLATCILLASIPQAARALSAADETLTVTTEFTTPDHSPTLVPDNTYSAVATRNGATYFVWANAARRPFVTHVTPGGATSVPLDPNPDYTALDDGHHKFSLGIDKNGYIHVTGDMHNYPTSSTSHMPARYVGQKIMYWRSLVPDSIAAGFEFTGGATDPRAIPGITFSYGGFYNDNFGELYWLCRYNAAQTSPPSHFIGERGVGLLKYNTVNDRWTALGDFTPDFKPGASYHKVIAWEDNAHSSTNFYQGFRATLAFDAANRMHFSVPINNDSAVDGPTHVIYGRSDDGGNTWKKADGTAVGVPMRVDGGQSDIVETNPGGDGTYFIFAGTAVDAAGNPAVFFSQSPFLQPAFYRYWTGSAWSARFSNPTLGYIRATAHRGPDGNLTFPAGVLHRSSAFGQAGYNFNTGFTSFESIDLKGLRQTGVIRGAGLKNGKLAVAAIRVFSHSAPAGSWDGGGADALWSTDGNWNTDGEPKPTITFNGSNRTTNTNDIPGLVFFGMTFADSDWSLSGLPFTLDGNLTGSAGRTVNIANDIILTGSTNRSIQTHNSPGGTLALSGNFDAGTLEIRKDGGGSDLVFNGAGKTVTFGTLALRKGGLRFENGVSATLAAGQIGNDATFNTTNPSLLIDGSATSVSFSGNVEVGRNANDTRLTLAAGSLAISGNLLLGQNTATTSGYYQTGGSASIGTLRPGNNGACTMELSGGTFTVANVNGSKLVEKGSTTLRIAGDTLLDLSAQLIAFNLATDSGSGILQLDGGTLATFGIRKTHTSGNTALRLNGGTLRATADNTAFLPPLPNTTLELLSGGLTIDTATFDVSATTSLTGTGPLTKTGPGILRLGGNHEIPGGIIIQTGTLELADSATLTLRPTDGASAPLRGSGSLLLRGGFHLDLSTANGDSWPLVDPALTIDSTGFDGLTDLSGSETFTATATGNGIWTSTRFTFHQATGLLTRNSALSAYQLWAAGHGPTEDLDGDGLPALLEYALGATDPTDRDAAFPVLSSPHLPQPRITFLRRSGGTETNGIYVSGDLTYQPFGSADLKEWNIAPIPVPNPPDLPAAPEAFEWTSYALPATSGITGRGFMKLKIVAE